MPKYIFNIQKRNNKFQLVDNWNEWISAPDKFNAQHTIEKAYPTNLGYKCVLQKEEG